MDSGHSFGVVAGGGSHRCGSLLYVEEKERVHGSRGSGRGAEQSAESDLLRDSMIVDVDIAPVLIGNINRDY